MTFQMIMCTPDLWTGGISFTLSILREEDLERLAEPCPAVELLPDYVAHHKHTHVHARELT